MLSHIRDRKLVQWLIAYAVAAWVAVQVLDVVSEGFGWSEIPLRIGIILAFVGAPVVAVLGWYHGEKGSQRVSRREALVLAALISFGGAILVAFGRPAEPVGHAPDPPGPAELDTTRYLVLPFRQESDPPTDLLEDLLLHDALDRWRGIQVVDPMQVRDAAARHPGPLDAGAAAAIAARFRAGRVVRGDVFARQDGIRLRAALHDAETGRLLADTTILLAPPATFDDSAAATLAAHLLFRGIGAASGEVADPATTSVEARRAFLLAQEAVLTWDLDRADSLLDRALSEDPGYARAHFWRAQVRNWNGEHPREVVTAAEIALAGSSRLPKRERELAYALAMLAREEYPAACAAYAGLRDADPRDFAAWFGLGECEVRDQVVVEAPRSPSGYAFRSSYHRGVQAFRRAYGLLPSTRTGFASKSFERMSKVLYLTTNRYRPGVSAADPRERFAALPALVADTLAHIPYPHALFESGELPHDPVRHWEAVEYQRRIFLEIATAWARAFPESVEAQITLALAYELLGDPQSLEILRRARARRIPARDRLFTVMAEEVKLLVKLGGTEQLERARALADSALDLVRGMDRPPGRDHEVLAALTGRAGEATEAARRGAVAVHHPVPIPAAVAGVAAALTGAAAFGSPGTELAALEATLEDLIRNRISPRDELVARHYLLDRAASLSLMGEPLAQALALARSSGFPLLRAQGALAEGDTSTARALLAQIRELRSELRPTEVALEALLPEASLWAALGDTATAAAVLDSTLNVLRWLEPGSLHDLPRAASLVRAMALRAELAAAAGDEPTARRWAQAVAVLWADADVYLQPLVRRMKLLTDATPAVRRESTSP